MINIELVPVDVIFPIDLFGMVFMQPYLEIDLGGEPYRWINLKVPEQINRISRTLEISKTANNGNTHFTIFPEYSIPGLEGVRKIQETVALPSWRSGTVVIGGVDGLSKDEYEILCNEGNTEVFRDNRVANIPARCWVNCSITWVKDRNAILKRWVQPKINPSWPERNITDRSMFCGSSVNLFTAKFDNLMECSFLSLICYDWIGRVRENYGIWAVLSEIQNICAQNNKKIDLVFVPQFNPEPNHNNFLENTRDYFVNRMQYPNIERDFGSVLFVNTAGGLHPGKYRDYGYSSLVFSPLAPYDKNGCPPTYSLKTSKLRAKDTLDRCIDVLFREMGACIHSFNFKLPRFINLAVPDRSLPLNEAKVHQIDAGLVDPRIPGDSVPASVKWVNDQLDVINSFLYQDRTHPLKAYIDAAHQRVCQEVKNCSDKFLRMSIEKVVFKYSKWIKCGGKDIHNVDDWDENEKQCLEILVHSLVFLGGLERITIKDAVWHGLMIIDEPGKGKRAVDLIVLAGGSSHQENLDYLDESKYTSKKERKTIIISRTNPDRPMTALDKKVFDTDTDIYRCGFHELVASLAVASEAEFVTKIKNVIGDLNG